MIALAPPLRFLLIVVGGWICLRAFMLFPGFPDHVEVVRTKAATALMRAEAASKGQEASSAKTTIPYVFARSTRSVRPGHPTVQPLVEPVAWLFDPQAAPSFRRPEGTAPAPSLPPPPAAEPDPPFLAAPALAMPARANRWSASAWLFFRRDSGGAPLAPGGTLGGSQAGARLLYRLNDDVARPLSLSARFYAPIDLISGSEAAFGLDWRPMAAIPVSILAERRQALGKDGRSTFALMLHGGVDEVRLPGELRLDAYAQAGLAGLGSRDPFADGAVRIARRIGPIEVGAGLWGATQPGASRLDIGPHLAIRPRIGEVTLRISADWRFRIAGDAAPDSGLTLTAGTDF